MKRFAIGLLLLTTTVAFAADRLVVANDQSGVATIWAVDPTGVNPPEALYSGSGAEAKAWGMAYDADTNTLYWNNGSVLYKSIYANPLVPVNMGTMTYNSATVNFVALGFKNGKLYGTRNIATEAVYAIDPGSLTATLEYQYNSAYDFGGLEFDPTNGKLYGLSDTAPAGQQRGLYEITLNPGSTTFKAPYPAGETDIDGLAVYNGKAYYVTDGPNTTQPFFYIYDVASGLQIGTLASPFTGSGTFCAATYVPEPASLILLGLAALVTRRRS
ncbi:MAG: PEP-CTERM sorting domain-containing protein [Phycisphaerales bacterium]|nr:PEP-CTERM sorting domain-containing protein [Phycisphaerales bacterium]